jgi:hypothetical protein
MRMVGERGFAVLAQARKAPRALKKRDIKVRCEDCKLEANRSYIEIKKYYQNGFRCYDCKVLARKADKKEINAALIALARRKGLIT